MTKNKLTLQKIYSDTLAPIEKVKSLLSVECDPTKVAKFTDAIEAAKKLDGKNLERKNYWGELSLWSRRRLGVLLKQADEHDEMAKQGRPKKGCSQQPFKLADLGLDKFQAMRAKRVADIPEEDIKEYIAAVNFDDVVADDLIETDRMKKWRKKNENEISLAGLMKFATGKASDHAHVSRNTGVPEWYTPTEYIESARKVMGTIDLDPATSKAAQKTVQAETHYTIRQDGLKQDWHGRTWLNPPYSSDVCPLFVNKLCESFTSKQVTEAMLLVNNATETKWFQQAATVAAAICFPAGRIKFIDDEGNPGAPLQGQAILYFGNKIKTFCNVFSQFGFCVETVV